MQTNMDAAPNEKGKFKGNVFSSSARQDREQHHP